jgi:hypothetical protein
MDEPLKLNLSGQRGGTSGGGQIAITNFLDYCAHMIFCSRLHVLRVYVYVVRVHHVKAHRWLNRDGKSRSNIEYRIELIRPTSLKQLSSPLTVIEETEGLSPP